MLAKKLVLITYSFDFRKYTMVNYQLADKKPHGSIVGNVEY